MEFWVWAASCARSFWPLLSVLRQTKIAWAFPSRFLAHHFSHSWFCALCNGLPVLLFLFSGGSSPLPFRFLSNADSFLLAKISFHLLVLSEESHENPGAYSFKCQNMPANWKRKKKSSTLQPRYSRSQLNRYAVFITISFLQSPSCWFTAFLKHFWFKQAAAVIGFFKKSFLRDPVHQATRWYLVLQAHTEEKCRAGSSFCRTISIQLGRWMLKSLIPFFSG